MSRFAQLGHRNTAASTKARLLPWPEGLILLLLAISVCYGPISQPSHYHDFADIRAGFGLPYAADVLSNLGFAIVGLLGLRTQIKQGRQWQSVAVWQGYTLFFAALLATAAGSALYHLAPDNARLVWDRLPIALACAGLLAAVWAQTRGASRLLPSALALLAGLSVLWWRYTDLHGAGDLRPYLLIQLLPLLLIPLLQWQYRRPLRERRLFGLAILAYVAAKGFELADLAVFAALGVVSGHTLKHLFATLAAWLIWRLLVGQRAGLSQYAQQ